MPRLSLADWFEVIGAGEFGHRDMVSVGDAHQRIAAIDDMDARRRSHGSDRFACGWREYRRGRCDRNGLARRNDQLLAGRQRARTFVAVGLQYRSRWNIVAARQDIERIAGADDDRGAAMGRRMGCCDRTRRNRAGGFELRMGRRRVGRNPAPATRYAARGCRIRIRGGDRRWRQGLGLVLALRPRILRQLTALDRRRRHRAGGLGVRGKGIGEGILGKARLHIGAAAGKANRHQRQHRNLRHATRAKQLGDTGHGYSLVRNKILF